MSVLHGRRLMRVVSARNVNEAYTIGMNLLNTEGRPEASRFGDVLVMPCPVTTVYKQPNERVLFNAQRDANPFFHLMESLWMLAGRQDVEWIEEFSGNIGQFSDNGVNFHAAYGHRWREHFDVDQIKEVIKELRENPASRRATMGMWDPRVDLNREGKDFPCNLAISFRVRDRRLDMTVFNRSNDIIWGAYGANAVHMSFLQEYVAGMLDMWIGTYTQVSNNFHAYRDVFERVGVPDPHPMDPYDMGAVSSWQIMDDPETWDIDLQDFMKGESSILFHNNFFACVAEPMRIAWRYHKKKDYPGALAMVDEIIATDWRTVCREWINRRFERYVRKVKVRQVAED